MNKSDLPESPYRNILFCTDFSENADHAFEYALDAARRRPSSRLHLLHVIPEPDAQFWKTYIYEVEDVDDKARRDVDEKIDQTYRDRVPEDIRFDVHVRVGKDYSEILDFAKSENVDLIVMGRHGRSALNSLISSGNVTEKVARKSTCPVLIVPPRG